MNLTIPCPDIGCYSNLRCYPEFKGRVIALSLIDKNYTSELDWSSPDSLIESLFYLALYGRAILFLKIAGEKPKPETAELAGSGMQISRPGAKTHTITFSDAQIVGNVEFYNQLLRVAQNYDTLYFTPSLVWDATGTMPLIIGDPIIENDLTKFITGETMVKWTSDDNPLPNEFDTIKFLNGLYYIVSGETNPATFNLGAGSLNYTAELNFDFSSSSLPDLIWSIKGNEADLILADVTMDPDSGIVSWSDPTAGTYDFTIKVTNAYGCIVGLLPVVYKYEAE